MGNKLSHGYILPFSELIFTIYNYFYMYQALNKELILFYYSLFWPCRYHLLILI
jgi:hypothetical protein